MYIYKKRYNDISLIIFYLELGLPLKFHANVFSDIFSYIFVHVGRKGPFSLFLAFCPMIAKKIMTLVESHTNFQLHRTTHQRQQTFQLIQHFL